MKKIIINGIRLGEARERKKLTQEEFAEKMAITRQTVVTWEGKEELKITDEQLKSIEKLLDITLKDLTKDVTRGTSEQDILDHPVIKSLVDQSKYIMGRVRKLEEENEDLKKRLGGSGV